MNEYRLKFTEWGEESQWELGNRKWEVKNEKLEEKYFMMKSFYCSILVSQFPFLTFQGVQGLGTGLL
jgi:hypothetical protein